MELTRGKYTYRSFFAFGNEGVLLVNLLLEEKGRSSNDLCEDRTIKNFALTIDFVLTVEINYILDKDHFIYILFLSSIMIIL